MRNLIMWNVITLDGCFEGAKNWDLPWHETIWGPELEQFSIDQLRAADMLLFGRVTYEGMAAYWRNADGTIADYMNRLPKIVFSRTLKEADWNNTTVVRNDVVARISQLKQQGNGDMFVFGSADLSQTLMNELLFDEYRLAIAPVIAGVGKPLFRPAQRFQQLELLETRALSSGAAILRYRPATTNPPQALKENKK